MYELIILSLLMRFPLHGYRIAKIAGDRLGPHARISNGTLYPILAKLEQSGLIAVTAQDSSPASGDHRSRAYRITEAGRQRFHQIMMDTASNLGEYQRFFLQKVSSLDLLAPRERLRLLDHYINYCQAHILYYQGEAADLVHDLTGSEAAQPAFQENILEAVRHLEQQWAGELAWARHLHKREQVAQESNPAGAIEAEAPGDPAHTQTSCAH